MAKSQTLSRIEAFAVLSFDEGRRLSTKKLADWKSRSFAEQVQYLKDHPNSIFQKVGVTRRKPKSYKEEEDNAENNKETDTDEQSEETSPDAENSDEEPATDEPAGDDNTSEEKPNDEDGNSKDEPAADGESDVKLPDMATKPRAPTDEEKANAEEHIKDLEADGALDSGSKEREGIASTIEAGGAKALASEMDHGDLDDLEKELEKLRLQNDLKEEQNRSERLSKGDKGIGGKVALTVGMLLLASAIGVGLFAVHPYLAMMVGQFMMENFTSIHSNIVNGNSNDVSAALEEDSDDMKAFILAVAELARNGELPDDFAEVCKLALNKG